MKSWGQSEDNDIFQFKLAAQADLHLNLSLLKKICPNPPKLKPYLIIQTTIINSLDAISGTQKGQEALTARAMK